MTSQIVLKQITEGLTSHSISFLAGSDCGPAAGMELTGGHPAINQGRKVVMFDQKFKGQQIGLTYENRPVLAALVAQYEAIQAEKQAVIQAKWDSKRAEREAIDAPLIEAMNKKAAELKSSIPVEHIEVAVKKVGDLDGDEIYEYSVDGFEINWSNVTIHGWATAIYPNAMAPFASVCVASISRQKLAELKAAKEAVERQKVEAAKVSQAELDQKFTEAKATGEKVFLQSWVADCNDPNEECSTDIISEWAMPDGTTKITRQHTW